MDASVIICTYNRAESLRDTKLLIQTLENSQGKTSQNIESRK
jgi:hypothetical protein